MIFILLLLVMIFVCAAYFGFTPFFGEQDYMEGEHSV